MDNYYLYKSPQNKKPHSLYIAKSGVNILNFSKFMLVCFAIKGFCQKIDLLCNSKTRKYG
jgi:hypothetical protein